MKKAMLFGMVLALGLLALGCDSGGGGGGGGNPYYGTTWDSAEGSLSFTENEWTMLETSGEGNKGTYTYSGATITFTETHRTSNSGATWTAIPAGEARSFTGTVSGNSLSMQGGHGTFGKRASGGGGGGGGVNVNPYVNTAWASDSGHVLLFTGAAEWIWTEPDGKRDRGTYTFSGNTVTLTQTEYSADLVAPWFPVTPDMGVTPDTGTVSGNTLIFASKPDRVMYKQSAGQGGYASPYTGTLWISDRGDGLLSFDGGEWITEYADGYHSRGTYTHEGSTITFTLTHAMEPGTGWMTVAELEAENGPYLDIVKNFSATVSGGTLSIVEYDDTYTYLDPAPAGPPLAIPENDEELWGDWQEHVESGDPEMSLSIGADYVGWDGSKGEEWKNFFNPYLARPGFECAWFAAGGNIFFRINYYGATVLSDDIYEYAINLDGQLVLTPLHGIDVILDRLES